MASSSSLERTLADLETARLVVHNLGQTVDSFQVNFYSIFNIVDQWRSCQASFAEVHNSLECKVKELGFKEREIDVTASKLRSLRDDVELKRKTVEDGERCLSERIKQVELRQNEVKKWIEVIELQKRGISERGKVVEAKERELVDGLERIDKDVVGLRKAELEVLERCKAVELRENVVDERCKAVELRENGVDERCKAVELRENVVDERCKAVELRENGVDERCKAVELRENGVEEWFEELKLREDEVKVRVKELELRGRKIKEREEAVDEHGKATELKEGGVEETEIRERYKEMKVKIKQNRRLKKALASRKGKLREKELEGEEAVDEHGRAMELKEGEVEETEIIERYMEMKVKVQQFRRRKKALASREKKLREKELKELSREIELKEKQLKELSRQVESKEMQSKELSREVESKEKQLNELSQARESMEKQHNELSEMQDCKEEQIFETSKGVEPKGKRIDCLLHDKVSEIELICDIMEANDMRSYRCTEEHSLLHDKFFFALSSVSDPAKLVLDVCQSFFETGLDEVANDAIRTKCIYMLEHLIKLSPSITSAVEHEATEFAALWKQRLNSGVQPPVTYFGYLHFIVAFKLEKSCKRKSLGSHFKASYDAAYLYPPETNVDLCRALGILDKIPDFVRALIRRQSYPEAVKCISLLKMEGDFHGKVDSTAIELSDLHGALTNIQNLKHKLTSSTDTPSSPINQSIGGDERGDDPEIIRETVCLLHQNTHSTVREATTNAAWCDSLTSILVS